MSWRCLTRECVMHCGLPLPQQPHLLVAMVEAAAAAAAAAAAVVVVVVVVVQYPLPQPHSFPPLPRLYFVPLLVGI